MIQTAISVSVMLSLRTAKWIQKSDEDFTNRDLMFPDAGEAAC
jgi:hypothetical protein